MADDDRSPRDALNPGERLLERIANHPEAFDFFQALRRLEALHADLPRLSEAARPGDEPIRLGQEPALSFAQRPLARLVPGENGQPPRLETYFFGLFGPNGPLPLHLTEYAFSRLHNEGDETFARFADMLHHRLASLLFRAWAESEPTVSHDRPGEDRFAMQLAALAGLGMESLRRRDAMPDLVKLHFTGRLAAEVRNPDGLRAILGSFLTTEVAIVEFVPTWVELPARELCLLGRDSATGTLGQTLTAGARIHVHHHRFRIVIGPLRLESYERLLPTGTALQRVVAILRNYVHEELDWELELLLLAEEVPRLRLGASGHLGWTSWLGTRRTQRPANDLRISAAVASLGVDRTP
ncbi:type VI secretion system protein ImpH [Arboricoccus pini]|uniref:Type VI secretion system protein ImpH n=1 Tax=Arboricoccus pini TaxID=1963835 RepID=A0A212RQF3_9PROT|nr:type VI secretion system baseplate subunit TssG [Arboricoccus pini]SNB74794.1 type VI secretion system protein ImpH [Arboricoccus pini]